MSGGGFGDLSLLTDRGLTLQDFVQEDGTELHISDTLIDPSLVLDHIVAYIIDQLSNRHKLTLIYLSFSGITDSSLTLIGDTFTNLKVLCIESCPNITKDGIKRFILQYKKQLKTLAYSGHKDTGDEVLQLISDNCPEMELVVADGCGISTIPETMGYDCPNLEYLYLMDNNIKKVPPSLTLLKDRLHLYLHDNPIERST